MSDLLWEGHGYCGKAHVDIATHGVQGDWQSWSGKCLDVLTVPQSVAQLPGCGGRGGRGREGGLGGSR